MRVERLDVGVDAKGHALISLIGWVCAVPEATSVSPLALG
jgi:hypothetical protein